MTQDKNQVQTQEYFASLDRIERDKAYQLELLFVSFTFCMKNMQN